MIPLLCFSIFKILWHETSQKKRAIILFKKKLTWVIEIWLILSEQHNMILVTCNLTLRQSQTFVSPFKRTGWLIHDMDTTRRWMASYHCISQRKLGVCASVLLGPLHQPRLKMTQPPNGLVSFLCFFLMVQTGLKNVWPSKVVWHSWTRQWTKGQLKEAGKTMGFFTFFMIFKVGEWCKTNWPVKPILKIPNMDRRTYIYIYIHTYIHTYIHIYTHIYIYIFLPKLQMTLARVESVTAFCGFPPGWKFQDCRKDFLVGYHWWIFSDLKDSFSKKQNFFRWEVQHLPGYMFRFGDPGSLYCFTVTGRGVRVPTHSLLNFAYVCFLKSRNLKLRQNIFPNQ